MQQWIANLVSLDNPEIKFIFLMTRKFRKFKAVENKSPQNEVAFSVGGSIIGE